MSDQTPGYDPNNPYAAPPQNNPAPNWPPPPGVGAPYPPVVAPVNGSLILVFGILGVTILHILAPFAWVMGNQAMATLDRYGDPTAQRSSVNAGRICGIIGTVFLGLGVLLGILYFIFIIGLIGFGATHPSSP